MLLLFAGGCSNLGFYAQSMSGQLDIWRRERSIEAILADPAASPRLKEKLVEVRAIREYAGRALALPDNGSYHSYADLDRRYALWNVFAAGPFSVEPMEWCFLFAGCVNYRGYFLKADADRAAAELAAKGYDVFAGGVPAYSTLGWFNDPVLSTFIGYPETDLARLLFHELAHQIVYVEDDTTFNESFAVAVEEVGMRRWLESHGTPAMHERYARARERQRHFVRMLADYRTRLAKLYASGRSVGDMRARKLAILDDLREAYRRLRAKWGGHPVYDDWFREGPNNAMLATAGIYTQYVPAFKALLAEQGNDLPKFYAAVKDLAALPKDERTERLEALGQDR